MQAHVFHRLRHMQSMSLSSDGNKFSFSTDSQFLDVKYSSTNEEQESDKEDQLMESIFFIHTD